MSQPDWHRSVDVVVVGAGAAGLPAAITARDHGASVVLIDENFDIGGHAMVSGGRINLGGGHRLQQALGIQDSAADIYADWTRHDHAASRYSDRELVRVFADENVASFDFLVENGVQFDPEPIGPNGADRVPRQFRSLEWPNAAEVIAPHHDRNGSGLVRWLEASARRKGVEILLRHKMVRLVREWPASGRVLAIEVDHAGTAVSIRASKGVVIATGGHTGNVTFRRMFDPRLTEEYQEVGAPYSTAGADGEIAALSIGAALGGTANQTTGAGAVMEKTTHIGCRWGSPYLWYELESPMFHLARATGLTVADWQDVILVKQHGRRFWNESDGSFDFFSAALSRDGQLDGRNGGGPIWAIFDSAAATREGWRPEPPHVDLDGYFAFGDTLAELAARIQSPYQQEPMSGAVLHQTVERYNAFVDAGVDADFGKPSPRHKIGTPPFYAAWATPMVHDSLTGLRTNGRCEVLDLRGDVIPGLYCAGESQGGFGEHGLGRCIVFGRVAGREAGLA